MQDGDMVYCLFRNGKEHLWLQGVVVEFEDAMVIFYRNVKGEIQLGQDLKVWNRSKEQVIAAIRKEMVQKLKEKLDDLEMIAQSLKEEVTTPSPHQPST